MSSSALYPFRSELFIHVGSEATHPTASRLELQGTELIHALQNDRMVLGATKDNWGWVIGAETSTEYHSAEVEQHT